MRCACVWLTVAACGADAPDNLVLRFTPDPGAVGGERYQCFGFDIAPLAGADLGGIAFLQADSPVQLHHLSLYASPSPYAEGPLDCVEMPGDAVPMNVWAPGSGDVVLADDVSLVIPEGTTHLIIQTHALRSGDGAAAEREIIITPRRAAEHRAGWLSLRSPVPVIQPDQRVESYASCALAGPLRLISTWPHMHQVGAEFDGSIVRGGPGESFVDVVPWVFDAQRTYALDIDVAAGDAIETRCVWENHTNAIVFPGFSINDEMCGQSLIAYPFEAAHCQ
jgi:hypothetical protein